MMEAVISGYHGVVDIIVYFFRFYGMLWTLMTFHAGCRITLLASCFARLLVVMLSWGGMKSFYSLRSY